MMPVNQSKQNFLFFFFTFFFFQETQKQSLFKDLIFWAFIFQYIRYALVVQYLG